MNIKNGLHRFKNAYVRFVERQGFPIIVTICVAVITGTALWRDQREEAYVSPTPPVVEDISAAQLMQQSLRETDTATPAPTTAPQRWTPPLDEIVILREFNANQMEQSSVTGIWAIHDAIDLKCEIGDKVYAISDGVVLAQGKDQLMGVWLQIDHGQGIEALYSGLAMSGAYIAGDKVRMGDTIGFAGPGPMDETDLSAHLHMRTTRNGQSIDPAALWQNSY